MNFFAFCRGKSEQDIWLILSKQTTRSDLDQIYILQAWIIPFQLTLKCGTRQDKGRRCQNVPLAGVNMRSCVTSLQLVNEKFPVAVQLY